MSLFGPTFESPPEGRELLKFLSLPTEICWLILSHMDKATQASLAKCSKKCYFLAFPYRFRGIRLSDNYERHLRLFKDGVLAPVKNCIHSVVFDLNRLIYPPLSSIAFLNPTSLTIKLAMSGLRYGERNLYFGIMKDLSDLPFYNGLTNLHLHWRILTDYDYLASLPSSNDSNVAGLEEDKDSLEGELDIRTRITYNGTYASMSEADKISMGPFISRKDAIRRAMYDINLPASLESLTLEFRIPRTDGEIYFTPLVACANRLSTLHIVNLISPIKTNNGDRTSTIAPSFPLVETLILAILEGYRMHDLSWMVIQFPNIKHLDLYDCGYPRDAGWINELPDFPKLITLGIPWPIVDGKNGRMSDFESHTEGRLKQGELKSLKNITFKGLEDLPRFQKNLVEAKCEVVRINHDDGRGEERRYIWEGREPIPGGWWYESEDWW